MSDRIQRLEKAVQVLAGAVLRMPDLSATPNERHAILAAAHGHMPPGDAPEPDIQAKLDAVTLPSRTFKPGWTPLTTERGALKAESANLKDLNCETDRALKAIAEALGIKVWYGFTPDDCLARIADLKASNARLLRLCKIVHEGDMCWDTPELEVELKEAIAKAVRP